MEKKGGMRGLSKQDVGNQKEFVNTRMNLKVIRSGRMARDGQRQNVLFCNEYIRETKNQKQKL